jgi:hypothetical protein
MPSQENALQNLTASLKKFLMGFEKVQDLINSARKSMADMFEKEKNNVTMDETTKYQERQNFAAALGTSIDSPAINDMYSSASKSGAEPGKADSVKAAPVQPKKGKGPFGWEYSDWMEEEMEHPTPRTRDLWYKILPPKPTTVECPKCGTQVPIKK